MRDRRVGMEFKRPMKRALMERAGGKCQSCDAIDHLEFDHVVPLFQGGTTTLDNGQVKTARELRAAFAHP